jgi:Fic family protein/DNA-binding XRE family transcriptional regulator
MKHINQLKSIVKASGWSQEQLAYNLGVSFATLNSWINDRSQPRRKALINIEKLYLDTVGVDSVSEDALRYAKLIALKLKSSPKVITENKDLLDILTLYLTYHTNTIEGSTMTLSDVEDVIFDHKVLSNRTAIEQAEARNHQSAFYWLLDQIINKGESFEIDEDLILGIHLRLMNGIISDAGQYRGHSVRIMGSHVTLANYTKIPELIAKLTDDIKDSPDDEISIIAQTHARFEQIHPFSDGNGRTGRLVMLAQALNAGFVPPLVIKERKYAYYKYLELAQTKGDFMPLELFVSESMMFTNKLLKK